MKEILGTEQMIRLVLKDTRILRIDEFYTYNAFKKCATRVYPFLAPNE
jgi:hypothetical protein